MTITNDVFQLVDEDLSAISELSGKAIVLKAAQTNITPPEYLSGVLTDALAGAVAEYKQNRLQANQDLIDKIAIADDSDADAIRQKLGLQTKAEQAAAAEAAQATP